MCLNFLFFKRTRHQVQLEKSRSDAVCKGDRLLTDLFQFSHLKKKCIVVFVVVVAAIELGVNGFFFFKKISKKDFSWKALLTHVINEWHEWWRRIVYDSSKMIVVG